MSRFIPMALSAILCLSALPVHAQDDQSGNRRPGVASINASEPTWFNSTINIDFRNVSLIDAIKKILEAAKVKYDRVEATFDLTKNKFSLSARDVNVRDALAAMARFGGAQAFVSVEDGKTVVELRKRINEVSIAAPARAGSLYTPLPGVTGTFTLPGRLQNTEAYKDLPQKMVEIKVTQGKPEDILKQIADQAELDYTVEPDVHTEGKAISVTMKKMSVGGALDYAALLLECGWKAEKVGSRVKVTFSKKYPMPIQSRIFMPNVPGMPVIPKMPTIPNVYSATLAPLMNRGLLPNKKVSLDKSKADPRESLKDILKQADLAYAIGDDISGEPRSFTFSDVSISTALDMICESIGASWSTERGTDGKILVRIRKGIGRARTSELRELYRTQPRATNIRYRYSNGLIPVLNQITPA